jgi:hypothetical protein
MAAKVGEDAEVPEIEIGFPERKMRKRRPWAATSGKPYSVTVSADFIRRLSKL